MSAALRTAWRWVPGGASLPTIGIIQQRATRNCQITNESVAALKTQSDASSTNAAAGQTGYAIPTGTGSEPVQPFEEQVQAPRQHHQQHH
jgi:hypothetical protein